MAPGAETAIEGDPRVTGRTVTGAGVTHLTSDDCCA